VTAHSDFRHVGGGAKGLFLAMRYVFVTATAYLLVFRPDGGAVAPAQALAIVWGLASTVLLSLVPRRMLFAAWLAAPLLIADTAWVTWALHSAGAASSDFFLLYFFVLLLAAIGEKPPMVVLGAVSISAISIHGGWGGTAGWTTPVLLRIVFLFTVALFYGHVLGRVRAERRRAERSIEWARSLEDKVAVRTAELHRLYEASRDASRAKTDFLASMSHEVRTPLHIIIGYADMLCDDAPPPEGTIALAERIRRAASGLLHLVDQVLEMGRLEAGRVQADLRPVPVLAFTEALRRREWISPLPGVAMRWDVDAGAARIDTDPPKLEIVLANLVTNALKYTHAGEVAITVRSRKDARFVDFRVDDTGPGIPPQKLARIREPFHESAAPGPHKLEGVGLGLAIVYRYATLLGADVEVRSDLGLGTSFTIAVPRHDDTTADAA
jgi:signal transduction histidine kinase